jgi:hypothetical protein
MNGVKGEFFKDESTDAEDLIRNRKIRSAIYEVIDFDFFNNTLQLKVRYGSGFETDMRIIKHEGDGRATPQEIMDYKAEIRQRGQK